MTSRSLQQSSPTEMMQAERLSSAGRLVQGPLVSPNRLHSIEAILGFNKEGGIFHKAASYTMAEKGLTKDAERNGNIIPVKKDHHSLDSRLS